MTRIPWTIIDLPDWNSLLMSAYPIHESEMSRRNETTCWATNHVNEGTEFLEVSRTNAREADGFIEGGVEVVLDFDRIVSSCGLCELTRAEAVDLATALLAAVLAPPPGTVD
jgi:hypothetical protein